MFSAIKVPNESFDFIIFEYLSRLMQCQFVISNEMDYRIMR